MFLSAACTKSETPFYDGTYNAVRFPYRGGDAKDKEPEGYDETTATFRRTYTFVSSGDLQSYDYKLPLELMGLVTDADRTVGYAIDAAKTTAPTGSYEILKAVIPAGKRQGAITIRLHNAEELKSMEYSLQLVLTASGELAAGPQNLIRGELIWSNRIPSPTIEDHIKTYNALIAGTNTWNSTSMDYFSPAALRIIVDALKWNNWDDLKVHGSNGNGVYYGKYKYLPRLSVISPGNQHQAYALALAEYIEKYNAEHTDNPLKHDAGLNKGNLIQARKYIK